ncbi:hypothetical protein [Blastococcus atacamensis]|uniref:hypothetical protein n=1 Tax=Blastococcus atacamensis TaxID=2070508 RepID=UPI000CEBDDFB|nr:hypothetical protein [Blastococcus atacamensis]
MIPTTDRPPAALDVHRGATSVRPLGPWRLEWLRLTRTRRWIGLAVPFLLFACTGPLMARYADELLSAVGTAGNITVQATAPTPADAMDGYTGNALQLGLLAALVVAAAALTVNARPTLAVFYRTRVPSAARLVLPRWTVVTGAAVAAHAAGTALAVYETGVLIGLPDIPAVLTGWALSSLYLVFALAVTAAVATRARSTLSAVAVTLAVVLVLPLLAAIPALEPWMPSTLAGAPTALLQGAGPGDYARAASVAAVVSGAALLLAIRGVARREL